MISGSGAGLPDGIFSILVWITFGGTKRMEKVGILFGHLEYTMAIW
jgi:hypothetical protein